MDERRRRIAENETRFRAINDRLDADLRRLDLVDGAVGFVCECGMAACAVPIELTVEEYAAVREDPMTFAVAPGHQIGDTEDVVGTGERFFVVRKHADVAPIVTDEPPH